MRPVIDLSSLNQYIETQHFQMEHLSSIKTLLKQGYYMTNLDLKDAYLSVEIHPQSQKYLRFCWKTKTYQFKALPFGLNIAPMIFTRLMKPVASYLPKRGVRLVIYLDDMLIIGASPEETSQFTVMAIKLLESLGFIIINKEKSIMTPTQVIQFLGFIINSNTMMILLLQEKVNKLQTLCRQILKIEKPALRSIAQLLGLLESYRPAIWKAPLHFRFLQALLIRNLHTSDHEARIQLPGKQKAEIQWWFQNIMTINGSPITVPPPDVTIFSDAAKQRWGAVTSS